jgi:hypothetical protein
MNEWTDWKDKERKLAIEAPRDGAPILPD